MNASEYAEKVSEIFVLPDSFIRIKELIDDESSTIDDISDVILIDPALASSILKLANSSLFNYPGKIDTISKAVLVLGITEVYNLVIAYFSAHTFKHISVQESFLENFWERSVDCALLIKFLGTSLNVANAERLFILGLLHNLGELVVNQESPEKVAACLSNNVAQLPWDKQQDVLGFTYGECSAELLKQWQLPYSLIGPIRNQDEFDQSSIESKLLYVAKRMMSANIIFKHKNYDDLLTKQQLTELNLSKELLRSASEFCDLERLGLLSVLSPSAAMIF
ncbi:MAG: HDOD domain-containing protein [Colwellia sp.]